jgi:choline dehydrogenase-like flavoprotein
MAQITLDDDSAVVIIGSGAGGGTLANELCQKGIKVVLLEAGARESAESFQNDEWGSFGQISWLDKRTTSGSWRVARDFSGLPAWICKTVGGSTTHWAGASLRIQEHEFKARTNYGDVAGANLLDWPLTLKDLEPYYASYKDCHTGRMAINSRSRDGRAHCRQLGFCFQGCKMDAKWSTMNSEIPKAEKTGNLDLRPGAQVLKIEHDKSGKVTAVVYADGDGNQQKQKARVVCVAGNSIETPRLLLNSESSMYPDGLANSSGQVGRNYMRHMTGSVYATFDEPVHMWRGTTMAGIITDEARHDLKPCRSVCRSWLRSLTRVVGGGISAARWTTMRIWPGCGWLAKTCHRKRIVLRHMPVRKISSACRCQTCTSMIIPTILRCVNMLSGKGARSTRRPVRQAHDIDNLFISDGSQFTTGAAENPTLTIVTLAIRQADYIARQMSMKAI